MEQVHPFKRKVSWDDLPKIYRQAFERQLNQVLVKMVGEPGWSDGHLNSNRDHARHFTLLETEHRLTTAELELLDELLDRGLTPAEADELFQVAHQCPQV